ncbi:Monocarboxylate transporter 9 [Armadillidium nasatum]|uniref:Monocarboxylate transporter 9 n=1 Tax=Armadillidium nasatum TaxID=96803 RepID=A0A5N5TE73_9CRUS|nr:Monocarboxylate transporter 9 [Armadillidium nasatum]
MMQQTAFVELESMNGNVSHHLAVMESCMPLDTIEEAREGSSLSGESDEHLDTICEELHVEIFEITDHVETHLASNMRTGLLASAGLYYVQMLKEFKQSRSYTAWMGSLMNAFFMLAGPLCSIVIRKTSCRTSIIIGSLLMTLGFMMSSMAKSLPFIFFSYGIVVAGGLLSHDIFFSPSSTFMAQPFIDLAHFFLSAQLSTLTYAEKYSKMEDRKY